MQGCSNINFNSAGLMWCCALLMLLSISLLVPMAQGTAFAEGGAADGEMSYKNSTVEIGLDTASVSAEIMPIDDGQANHAEVKADIAVTSSSGYKIYIGSKSPLLMKDGTSTTDAIEAIDSEEGYEYNYIPTNQWGYTAYDNSKGSFNATAATYYPMPSGGRGKVFEDVEEDDLDEGADERSYTISFAANIDSTKPSGKYSSEVTLSVISSPAEVANSQYDFGVTYMQDLDKTKCSTANTTVPVGATTQLKDNRDEKSYWVTKMPDGHCWMTQNLDLDLPATAISSTSNQKIYNGSQMSAAWTPTAATTTDVTTNNSGNNPSKSWDQGLYVIKDPTSTSSANCTGSATNKDLSVGKCSDFFQNVTGWTASDDPEFTSKHSGQTYDADTQTYDAHYLVGNWYQWAAATAGTGTGLQSTKGNNDGAVTSLSGLKDAPSSICPKGWRLPTSGRNGDAESTSSLRQYYTWNQDYSFGKLLTNYGWTGTSIQSGYQSLNVSVLTSYTNQGSNPPLFFVRSGLVDYTGYLNGSGYYADYWSSTAYTTTSQAYYLRFNSDTTVTPSNANDRYYGYSVRCLTQ